MYGFAVLKTREGYIYNMGLGGQGIVSVTF